MASEYEQRIAAVLAKGMAVACFRNTVTLGQAFDEFMAANPNRAPTTDRGYRDFIGDPLRRDRPAPCGQVDSRSATDHFPTGPETATEAVNSYGT